MAARGLKPGTAKKISDRPLSIDTGSLDIRALLQELGCPLLLTPQQVSKLTNVSMSSLAKSRMNGVMPGTTNLPEAVTVGRGHKSIRYRLVDILRWIEDLEGKQAG